MTNGELQICHSSFIIRHLQLSGWQDSNLRPSAPKADALAGLRYTPIFFNAAERAGFEPAVPLSKYGSLANYWFKPLTHLSFFKGGANLEKKTYGMG